MINRLGAKFWIAMVVFGLMGQVFVPGLIGPAIGAWVLRNADILVNDDGTESFIPNQGIWSAALVVVIILVVVIFLTMRNCRGNERD